MTITKKLMSLAEMQARWDFMTVWTGRGMELCPRCLEKFPVLYMNVPRCHIPHCRSCFCQIMAKSERADIEHS